MFNEKTIEQVKNYETLKLYMEKYSMQRWDSDAFDSKEIAQKIKEDLKYKLKIFPHPFSAWRSEPNQNLETIKTNENGLRSKSLKNLRFKKNAVILGNSVAWGFGASSNENTPAYLIEEILYKKYKKEFNVINLADQMYTSFEELKSFMVVADELKPELVIFLTGTNDVYREYIGQYKIENEYRKYLNFYLWGQSLGIINEKNKLLRIIKCILKGGKKFKEFKDEYYILGKPLKNNIAKSLFKYKLDWVNSYCENKKIPVAHFLQPDLHFKKFKSKTEGDYLKYKFTEEKSNFVLNKFKEIELNFFNESKTNSVSYLSLLDVFDNEKDTIFFDETHFSDNGYKIICNKICENLIKLI